MKILTLTAFLIMSVTMISCGGDKEKSSSGSSSSQFSVHQATTKDGFYNLQTQALEVGSQVYPPNQAYAQVMNMALQQAQMKNIRPTTHNGVQKFRAKITAQLMNSQQGYTQPYNNQQGTYNQGYNQTGYNQGTLMLQNVVIY